MNRSRSALQRPFFGRTDAGDPLPLSLVDLSSRRPEHCATSSPAESVLGGTSPGNWYQKAGEDHIDCFMKWMEDDYPEDIVEQL